MITPRIRSFPFPFMFIIALCALAAAGCGGDDGSTTKSEPGIETEMTSETGEPGAITDTEPPTDPGGATGDEDPAKEGAGDAATLIVPQTGIGPVSLGMPKADVEAALGKPTKVDKGTNELGREYENWTYADLNVNFDNGGDVVTNVNTDSGKYRTAADAGVGTTEADLVAAHPEAKCEGTPDTRSCTIGTFTAGETVTDFIVQDNTVTRVTIGVFYD